MASSLPFLLTVSLLLLSPTLSDSFFTDYHTLVSVSHSLTSRVASLRESRGDVQGAARARNLAKNIERATGLGFYRYAFSVGWDYLRNHAWRGTVSPRTLSAILSDLSGLWGPLRELSRINSDAERIAWVSQNYQKILRISKSLFTRLLEVFRHSGPLRELVEGLRKEIVDGDLLKDCLELGADDLQGLIQVLKNIALSYGSSSSTKTEL